MRNTQNQNQIYSQLQRIFGIDNVAREWNVTKNSSDQFTRDLYCPRIDFAVGPFNIDANIVQNNELILASYGRFKVIIEELKSASDARDEVFELNRNPRCFLAIELEDKTSRKHRLGSMFNASAIGKIGVIVASNEEVFGSLVKIRKYFDFLKNVWKSPYAPKKIMVLTNAEFLRILTEN